MTDFNLKIQKIFVSSFVLAFSLAVQQKATAEIQPITKNGEQHWVIPGLKVEKQKQNNWCWAATSRIALSQKSPTNLPSQCEIVSKTLGKNCCQRLPALGCNVPYRMEKVFSAMKLEYKTRAAINQKDWKTPDYSGFMATSEAIKKGKVVIVAYQYTGQDFGTGGSHVVVAFATYKKKDGATMVVTYDPYTGRTQHLSKKDIYGNMRWSELYMMN